jgi:predicted DCC family thiol-disulfide oxidoreductase YuxK
LCNQSINFIIDKDPGGIFKFAPLQSDTGEELLAQFPNYQPADSVLLIANGKIYDRSTAALKIAGYLQQPWPLTGIAWVVPKVVRDWVYGIIARNRYRWFGKQATCRMPTPALKARFLAYQPL